MKNRVYDALKRHMDNGTKMEGIVSVYMPGYGLIIDNKNCKIVIGLDEIEAFHPVENYAYLTGQKVYFMITEIDKDADIVFASRKAVQEYAYPRVIEALKSMQPVQGVIVNILNYGAYVDIKGIPVLLKNIDYSEDDTTVGDDYKTGSSIDVVFLKESDGVINVTVPKKVKKKTAIKASDLEIGSSVCGKVTGWTPTGIFVKAPGGIDVLCEVPEEYAETNFKDYVSEVGIIITKIRPQTDDQGQEIKDSYKYAGKLRKIIKL